MMTIGEFKIFNDVLPLLLQSVGVPAEHAGPKALHHNLQEWQGSGRGKPEILPSLVRYAFIHGMASPPTPIYLSYVKKFSHSGGEDVVIIFPCEKYTEDEKLKKHHLLILRISPIIEEEHTSFHLCVEGGGCAIPLPYHPAREGVPPVVHKWLIEDSIFTPMMRKILAKLFDLEIPEDMKPLIQGA
ncbi:MAG: hypothetical protein COY40_00775 [Alphaproteobacteria bacterium CG_4_10_14_0_8_um_filter_53_9]|nr:MAG: hypothetical protein COY40_00775 [Alphaproteobacteria bacterium CG_4_10_14_0_8_um_filter_53_9]